MKFRTPRTLKVSCAMCTCVNANVMPSMLMPSVFWYCWLGGRKGIRPVKTEWWGASVVRVRADLHTAQLMPLPLTVTCFSKIQTALPFWYRLTWVVLEKGPLNGCVCKCKKLISCHWLLSKYTLLPYFYFLLAPKIMRDIALQGRPGGPIYKISYDLS